MPSPETHKTNGCNNKNSFDKPSGTTEENISFAIKEIVPNLDLSILQVILLPFYFIIYLHLMDTKARSTRRK